MPNYAGTDVTVEIPVANYTTDMFEDKFVSDKEDGNHYISTTKVFGVTPHTFLEVSPRIPVAGQKLRGIGENRGVFNYNDETTFEEIIELKKAIVELGFDPTKIVNTKQATKFIEKAKAKGGENIFDGYEGNVANLDTKGLFELEDLSAYHGKESTTITFRTETAGSPPEAGLYKIVEMLPKGTTIHGHYELEGDEGAHGDDCYDEDEDEYQCHFDFDNDHGCEPLRYEGMASNG